MTISWKRTCWAALVIAAAAAPVAQAQTVANGPYYATPSWSQKLPCDSSANCPRFVVLANWNNEAVLDRETGLVWERAPSTSADDWGDAHRRCIASKVGGRTGWRLPTISEFYSLTDRSQPLYPTLPVGHPFAVVGEFYWSATTVYDRALSAHVGSLRPNTLADFPKADRTGHWCVRGGSGN